MSSIVKSLPASHATAASESVNSYPQEVSSGMLTLQVIVYSIVQNQLNSNEYRGERANLSLVFRGVTTGGRYLRVHLACYEVV